MSDSDSSREQHIEAILGKPWAITREAAIEVVAWLARRGLAQTPIVAAAATFDASADRSQATDGSAIAVIPLRGAISPRGSLFSLLFGGGGGLQMFREQFRQAVADGNVSAIVLDIDSPGGLVSLVPETASEILAARGSKPIVAVANTMAASAAYWIASACDQIVATPSAMVGSIGVFTIHEDFSRMEEAMGIKTTLISAGQFKVDGNPYEPLSKTARSALQNEVDELYDMFTARIAEGRGVSQKAVQAGYGRGRCLLAQQALQTTMVDSVETLEQVVARLGERTARPKDPPAQPDDLIDDRDDGPIAKSTTRPRPVAQPTPRQRGDYLSLEGRRNGVWQLPGSVREYEVRFRPAASASVRVDLSSAAADAIRRYVAESPGIETGGVLLGRREVGRVYVTDAGPPGPLAERTTVSLRPDGHHDQSLVREIVAATAGRIVEIGNWHLHPNGVLRPSVADQQRMCDMADLGFGAWDDWCELIVGAAAERFGRPPMSAWVARRPIGRDVVDFIIEPAGVR